METDILQIVVDFGLVVLIWLVQLVIYPSFLFYSEEALKKWHGLYTMRITYVVMPLMLLQLVVAIWNCFLYPYAFTVFHLILIIIVWLSTFLQFVPRHQKIASGKFDEKLLQELVTKNWIRTAIWSAIFLADFI